MTQTGSLTRAGKAWPKKARIEIIPLIDIMFFLLASFMLVSISMVKLQGMQMILPGIRPLVASSDPAPQTIQLLADGRWVWHGEPTEREVVLAALTALGSAATPQTPDVRVMIRADEAATHGMVVEALDQIREAGIMKVSFSMRPRALREDGSIRERR